METIKNTILELENELFNLSDNLELEYFYHEDSEFSEYFEELEESIFNEGIIYYSKAMEFLQENDPSLRESLSIACEFGFQIDDLNSETLATLLHQRYLFDELYSIKNDIEDIFDRLDELKNQL